MDGEELRQRLGSQAAAAAAAGAGVVWGLLKSFPPWPVRRQRRLRGV